MVVCVCKIIVGGVSHMQLLRPFQLFLSGGEILHAPLEQHGNVQSRQRGQRKSARESKQQQNTARQYACMRAMHTKQCIQQNDRPTCSCEVLASSRPLNLRAGSLPERTHGRRPVVQATAGQTQHTAHRTQRSCWHINRVKSDQRCCQIRKSNHYQK
jgi:hypothetical protein